MGEAPAPPWAALLTRNEELQIKSPILKTKEKNKRERERKGAALQAQFKTQGNPSLLGMWLWLPLIGQHWSSPGGVLGLGSGSPEGSSTPQSPPALLGCVEGSTGLGCKGLNLFLLQEIGANEASCLNGL